MSGLHIALVVALAIVVGVALGLLGGGGSILTVPLLTYVADMSAGPAIAVSLLVVGVTSAVAAVSHARAGRVRWGSAWVLGVAAMCGAYLGAGLARLVADRVLLVVFAVVMVTAGAAMIWGHGSSGERHDSRGAGRMAMTLPLGLGVGMLSGLIGAGGGFLLVPVLVVVARLSMPVAVGTSLVVIALQSFAGLAGHLTVVAIDWRLAGLVTLAAVAGALFGARLAGKVDPIVLRRGFGLLVFVIASVVLAVEVHPVVGAVVIAAPLLSGAIGFVCDRVPNCRLRHLRLPGAVTV